MRQHLTNLRRQWLVTAGCVLAIATALLVPSALLLAGLGLERAGQSARATLQAEIVLTPQTTPAQAEALSRTVRGWGNVETAELRDGAANLLLLQKEVEGLGALEADMLPTTIHVTFAGEPASFEAFLVRLKGLGGMAEVEGVEAGTVAAAALAEGSGPMRWILIVSAVLVGLVGLAVVANALGLGIFRRREEIEIFRRIGATDRHVVWPFVAEALWMGLFGGLLTAAVAGAGLVLVAGPLADALPFVPFDLAQVALWVLPAMVLGGVVLSSGGALLSVRVYLRQVEGMAW